MAAAAATRRSLSALLLSSRALPRRLLPLTAAAACSGHLAPWAPQSRGAKTTSSGGSGYSPLNDPSPNWSNRPPKETILLDGCDFEHWLVVMEPPPGNPGNPDVTREEVIDGYIKTLAQVVGSEEEARQKIYSVSTRHYFAFGALVSEELSYKIKDLPKVRWVLPDSYLDVKNKDYGGEPFINGEAVPYDPKYHEEWVRNNARANERSRRNDRPRNFDRSRNFERRRENMQNFQNRDVPPGQGFSNSPPPPGQNQMPSRDAPPMHHVQGNMPPPPPPNAGAPPMHHVQGNMPPPPPPNAGAPPSYQPHALNPQAGYTPGGGPNYQQGGVPGYQGGPPDYQAGTQGYQGNPGGSMHSGPGPAYQSNNPGFQGGGPGYQGGSPPPYQGGNPPPFRGGNPPPYQGGNPSPYQGGSPSYAGGGGGAPGHQGEGGNPSYEQGGNNYYDGRDGPGRSYQ